MKVSCFKAMLMASICISLLSITQQTNPEALVPAKFSQAWNFYEATTDKNYGGKLWFDDSIKTIRNDFNYGSSCDQLFSTSKSCTVLIVEKTAYWMLPQKSLCCITEADVPVSRQIFKGSQYRGIEDIDGENYDFWWIRVTSTTVPDYIYYADRSTTQKPRRLSLVYGGGRSDYDLLPQSYSQNFNSKAVLSVPSYCKKSCPQIKLPQNTLTSGNVASSNLKQM